MKLICKKNVELINYQYNYEIGQIFEIDDEKFNRIQYENVKVGFFIFYKNPGKYCFSDWFEIEEEPEWEDITDEFEL